VPGARLSTRGRRPVEEERRLAGRLGRQANRQRFECGDGPAVALSVCLCLCQHESGLAPAWDSSSKSRSWVDGTAGLVARQNPREAAREDNLKQLLLHPLLAIVLASGNHLHRGPVRTVCC
jgi:hypothetical protein